MINSNSAISASNASQASPSGARGKTETASPETPVIIRVEHDIVLKSANPGPFQAATYNPCGVVFSFGVTPPSPSEGGRETTRCRTLVTSGHGYSRALFIGGSSNRHPFRAQNDSPARDSVRPKRRVNKPENDEPSILETVELNVA